MSSAILLSAPGPAAQARELAPVPAGSAPARGELSPARALPPVTNLAPPLDARFLTARDRPVGPPPAFKVSLLQHIFETSLRPDPRATDRSAPDEVTPSHALQKAGHSPFTLSSHAEAGAQIDMKL